MLTVLPKNPITRIGMSLGYLAVELEPSLELGVKILFFCVSTWFLLDYICDCKVPTFTGFVVLSIVLVVLLVVFCFYKKIIS